MWFGSNPFSSSAQNEFQSMAKECAKGSRIHLATI